MTLERQFGENVRFWRKKRGLSQEEFADRAELHPTYVSGIETGRRNPTLRIVERISTALEINPEQLLTTRIEEKS